MGDGKRKLLPCGHIGEAVVGHYYSCPCDFADEDPTPNLADGVDVEIDLCPSCGSDNVADFDTHWQPLFDPQYHCWDCGRTWTK